MAGLAAGPLNQTDPAALVKLFYEFWLSFHASGLPSRVQREKLSPFLSSDLLHLIRDAQEHQERFGKEHPAEKLPLSEGDLFSSNSEGATSVTIGAIEATEDGGFRVVVHFAHEVRGDTWEDALLLKQEGQRLAIDDVEFLGSVRSSKRGTLTEALKRRD